jgi:hypothetical protein
MAALPGHEGSGFVPEHEVEEVPRQKEYPHRSWGWGYRVLRTFNAISGQRYMILKSSPPEHIVAEAGAILS